MTRKIFKKDFEIKSRRSGNRLKGMENQVVYEVFTADGEKMVKGGFYKRDDAEKWLTETVKLANMILEERRKNHGNEV